MSAFNFIFNAFFRQGGVMMQRTSDNDKNNNLDLTSSFILDFLSSTRWKRVKYIEAQSDYL